jgi:hypothetical protein
VPSAKVLVTNLHNFTQPLVRYELADRFTSPYATPAGGWPRASIEGRATPAGTLRTGRGGHTASVLPDGRVLIAGGWSSSGQITASVEIFDPTTNSFNLGPAMPGPRGAAAAVTLSDGSILVTGGRKARYRKGLTSTVIYDPATNAWRDGPTMSTPRLTHAVIALNNGGVLVLGGTTDDTEVLDSTEILDPGTLRSTPGPAMSTVRYKFADAVARTSSGQVVVAGGSGIDVLAPDGGRFHALTTSHGVRSFATATALLDGGVLIIGGYDDRIRIHPDAFLAGS